METPGQIKKAESMMDGSQKILSDIRETTHPLKILRPSSPTVDFVNGVVSEDEFVDVDSPATQEEIEKIEKRREDERTFFASQARMREVEKNKRFEQFDNMTEEQKKVLTEIFSNVCSTLLQNGVMKGNQKEDTHFETKGSAHDIGGEYLVVEKITRKGVFYGNSSMISFQEHQEYHGSPAYDSSIAENDAEKYWCQPDWLANYKVVFNYIEGGTLDINRVRSAFAQGDVTSELFSHGEIYLSDISKFIPNIEGLDGIKSNHEVISSLIKDFITEDVIRNAINMKIEELKAFSLKN